MIVRYGKWRLSHNYWTDRKMQKMHTDYYSRITFKLENVIYAVLQFFI